MSHKGCGEAKTFICVYVYIHIYIYIYIERERERERVYLTAWDLTVAYGLFSCNMWDLSSQTRD